MLPKYTALFIGVVCVLLFRVYSQLTILLYTLALYGVHLVARRRATILLYVRRTRGHSDRYGASLFHLWYNIR